MEKYEIQIIGISYMFSYTSDFLWRPNPPKEKSDLNDFKIQSKCESEKSGNQQN